jgi:hypothetical protein
MTNYIINAQVDRGQLVLAVAVLRKAQEVAEAKRLPMLRLEGTGLAAPPPLETSKFTLNAYNSFTRNIEVVGLAVARFLLGQLSAYIARSDTSVTINFHRVKVNFRRALICLVAVATITIPYNEKENRTMESATQKYGVVLYKALMGFGRFKP